MANDAYEHAFGLLASAELGDWPGWTPPADQLRQRIETLALCMGVVPRLEAARLESILQGWRELFPEERPVAASELRESALGLLRQAASSAGEQEFQRALALARAPLAHAAAEPAFDVEPRGFSEAEAQRQCAFGLGLWLTQVATHQRWRYLPAIVPGESATAIDKVYVELYAVSSEDAPEQRHTELRSSPRQSQRLLAAEYPVVSLPSMVSRTMQRCVVMGEPGSGKSTLVQWLAWASHQSQLPDFDGALVVKLSGFAAAGGERPRLTLLEYFFAGLDTNIEDWRPGAFWMRRVAGASHRFLLLLDGWDEVPVPQRETVRQRILDEQPYFVTLITSRPSGLPRQLDDGERTDHYVIAGLTPAGIEELVQKLLQAQHRIDLLETIRGRILDEPDLLEMAANPFLLGLMVRAFLRSSGAGSAPRTRAEVYQQVMSWMQEQYNQGPGADAPLTPQHTASLRRLSHFLLFDCDPPRYIFRGEELTGSMQGCAAEPVCRSRYVNRTDPVFDEFAFLHATFQEHLAAEHAASLSQESFDLFFDLAFASTSRLLVLELAAGLSGPVSGRCRKRALTWLERRDRFQQVLLRLGRIAAAGRWSKGSSDSMGRTLREELWAEIRRNRNMPLTKAAVEVLADLDASDLARRARAATGLDNWAIQCIVDAVPKPVARRERLDELLDGRWRDYAGFDARGGATGTDRRSVRSALENPAMPRDDLLDAVIHAGAMQDGPSVPLLVSLLRERADDSDLREHIIDSLGTIGGREAVDALIDVVLGTIPASADQVNAAVAALRHSGSRRKALDPPGRDRLLRQLAALPPEAPQVHSILAALEACPLREGVGLIAALAQSAAYSPSLRFAATQALTAAIDRRQIQTLVLGVETETSGNVIDGLLNLAVLRSLYVPLGWLERKITAARDRNKRRELLTAFLTVLPSATGTERENAEAFLGRLLAQALADDDPRAAEMAWACERALSRMGVGHCPLPSSAFQLAVDVLARFSEAAVPHPSASVTLAVSLLVHFNDPMSSRDLRKALDAALRGTEGSANDITQVQRVLVRGLAELAPGELLDYPPDCDCVQSALCQLAVERGWLIYPNRIVGAEGFEIASTAASEDVPSAAGQPADLKALMELLPEQSKRVLYSYWLMVREGSACRPRDAYQSIYAAMASRIDGAIEDQLTPQLDALYADGLPLFESWRKTLKRIEDRFAGNADMLALLRRIGLCRRRKS
jgi:energy-coupling factor transporter ATP-binding protein EcfA2